MPNNLLQAYLNKQFIKTSDEGNVANLKKAAIEVSKRLTKKKKKILPFTLVAIDPFIAENDPAVVEVEKIIIAKWPAFKNSVTQTKDKATTYIRIVILEALSQLAKDELFAAIIWHTSRNVISYLKISNEGVLLREFLLGIGNDIEASSKVSWGINNSPNIPPFTNANFNIDAVKPAKVNEEGLTSHLKAAAVHSGWKTQAGGGENPHHQGQNTFNWPKFFAERAAKGITEEVNTAFVNQIKAVNSIPTSLQKELDKYFSQLQPFFEQISQTLTQGVIVNNKRSELLWWKQTLFSPSLDKSYRSFEPVSLAISMAADLANLVAPIYPCSIDFLLKEALKDVQGDQIDTPKELADLIEQASKMNKNEKELLRLLVSETEGRKPFGTALANILAGITSPDIFTETGIDKKAKISLADFAVWLFHDIQAAKIASTK